MRRVNVGGAELSYDDEDPEGFRAGMARVGRSIGATDTGASVYELPPGQAICPYHYEHGEEEWLLVVAGRPSVRTPEGVEELAPMDLVFFPKGPDGAHQVRNDSGEPARVVMWSTVIYPGVSVYPDSGKIGVWTGGDRSDDVIVERSSGVDYWQGESR